MLRVPRLDLHVAPVQMPGPRFYVRAPVGSVCCGKCGVLKASAVLVGTLYWARRKDGAESGPVP
jgi:hypothetical protein